MRTSETGRFAVVIAVVAASGAHAGPAFQQVVVGPRVDVVASAELAKRASEEWQAIPDRSDAQLLDEFVRRFPDSNAAVEAFTIRYALVRASGSIDAYNEFIAAHPRRAAAQLAVGEVFAKYRAQDRLSGYADFVRRYPNTPQAVVAALHAQQIAFELATLLDTVEAYDDFLLTFPDAPHVPGAVSAAQRRLLAVHQAEYEAQKTASSPRELEEWVNRRLRSMRFAYHDLWTAISVDPPTAQTLEFLERDVLGWRPTAIDPVLRRNLAQRMERIYYVVRWFDPYRTAEASDAIVAESRHQELMAKLDELRVTLERNHRELVATLGQEMYATREVLRRGFDELIREHRLDRQAMEKGFDGLEQSMKVLHEDLGAVYSELRDLHATVKDVGAGIRETNARLERLDHRLYDMHRSLVSMHDDMNRGFLGVEQRIARLNDDLNEGFARQHTIALAQLEVAGESLAVQRESLEVQRESVEVQTQALYAIHSGFEDLGHTMNAGFARVEQATFSAASMITESNRRLIESAQPPPASANGGGGFFQGALGTLGKFVPGVGPILGEVAGNVLGQTLDQAVAGRPVDPLSLSKTALTTAVGAKFGDQYPGAARIAGSVYDAAVTERRGLYEQAGRVFSGGGVTGGGDDWRAANAAAATPAEFRHVAETMAQGLGVPAEAVQFAVEHVF